MHTTSRSSPRTASKPDRGIGGGGGGAPVFDGILVVTLVLLIPVALYCLHLAPHARLAYPAANLLLAIHLFARRSPWYAGQCVLLFCFVSLVRRLIDAQAGWDPSSPVLLTPYLCCSPAVVGFIRYWLRPQPRYIGIFLLLLGCIAYGVALAMLNDRLLASLVDALKWGVGPIFAVYALSECERRPALRRTVEGCLIWAGALMGLYGVVQFVAPPVWDAIWMRGAAELGLDSIGQPSPFAVRVFSTMNSPGSFGTFMTAGIVLALKRGVRVTAATVPPMSIGLALCQYRSIWAATAVAVLMVALPKRARVEASNITVLAVMLAIALGSMMAVEPIREAVVHRASTLDALRSDASLRSRLDQYAQLARNDSLLLGEGLALNGASRRLDKGRIEAIDGAPIEIWRGMGVLIGTTFLLALLAPVGALLSAPADADRQIYFDRAIVVSTLIQLPIGSVHAGELGFCAWTFMGLGLAELSRRAAGEPGQPVEAAVGAPLPRRGPVDA